MNLNDFGFAKIPIPKFQGNVKDFTKWRSQVEDYLNKNANKSTEKQAVQLLDRLTPKDIDVSKCPTLKEAWEKLTGEYGLPVHIACLLLKDFSEFKLTKLNDESNLVQLRNTLDKLQSDLITNEQQERCDDFSVIDHAESLIPGRFRHQYVEMKDELLTTHLTPFTALSTFLE